MIVLLSLVPGFDVYLGAGVPVIIEATNGNAVWYAFIVKLLFTVITMGSGYKGGEIVPAFFIGATFGCVFGHISGFPAPLAAACGMAALFCGVTNCPIATILLSVELFGGESALFCMIAALVSFLFSGYFSLYSGQQLIYSKLSEKEINVHGH